MPSSIIHPAENNKLLKEIVSKLQSIAQQGKDLHEQIENINKNITEIKYSQAQSKLEDEKLKRAEQITDPSEGWFIWG